MNNIITFFDLDGVISNWDEPAMKFLGADPQTYIPILKAGGDLEDYFPNQWEILDSKKDEFWTEMEVYPWAYKMIELAQKYGEVAFLSSGGNVYKRPVGVGDAAKGKTIWVEENFKEYNIPLILARDKHLCASPRSLLVDDRKDKVNDFIKYGGHGFQFPIAYKILHNEIPIESVLGELERKLQSLTIREVA